MWQYAILAVVAQRPGLHQAEAATRLDYSKNRIVADLDRLEERGLLVRERHGDRRANQLRITDTGQTVRAAIQRDIHDAEDRLLASLPPARRRALERTLQLLSAEARDRRG